MAVAEPSTLWHHQAQREAEAIQSPANTTSHSEAWKESQWQVQSREDGVESLSEEEALEAQLSLVRERQSCKLLRIQLQTLTSELHFSLERNRELEKALAVACQFEQLQRNTETALHAQRPGGLTEPQTAQASPRRGEEPRTADIEELRKREEAAERAAKDRAAEILRSRAANVCGRFSCNTVTVLEAAEKALAVERANLAKLETALDKATSAEIRSLEALALERAKVGSLEAERQAQFLDLGPSEALAAERSRVAVLELEYARNLAGERTKVALLQ
ncbi:unnamed protein product, partial [Polarella glacialis]